MTNNTALMHEFDEIESIECIGFFEDEYVYDIEMLDESHTFISNDILVHNTDSCEAETKIQTDSGETTIEQIFQDGSEYWSEINGTEHRRTTSKILNWSETYGVELTEPISICRHKVTKPKWELITYSEKRIVVTGDHSLIVFRNENKISVKAADIVSSDKILIVNNDDNTYSSSFDDIKTIKQIGFFENEYVYDISMPKNNLIDEDVQTFIGNDILIHNSNYLEFGFVFQSLGLDPKKVNIREATEFIVYFMQKKMNPFYDRILKASIAARNGKSTMEFELEVIGGFGIFAAKKKYVFAKLWQDGKHLAEKKMLKSTGIELAQKSSPMHVRSIIKTFVNTIFVRKGDISSDLFFGMCKSVKSKLADCKTDELSKMTKLGKYDVYVIDDKDTIKLKSKCPLTVRGAATYNQIIYQKKLSGIYPYLKNGMQCKVYYDVSGKPVAYPVDIEFPDGILPQLSVDIQLEKLIFGPIKRLVSGGLIDGDLDKMGKDKIQKGFSGMFGK